MRYKKGPGLALLTPGYDHQKHNQLLKNFLVIVTFLKDQDVNGF